MSPLAPDTPTTTTAPGQELGSIVMTRDDFQQMERDRKLSRYVMYAQFAAAVLSGLFFLMALLHREK